MKITIQGWESSDYVEVSKVVEMRDGCVYKTKRIGFARRDRPKKDDEVYSSGLSTSLMHGGEIELLEG